MKTLLVLLVAVLAACSSPTAPNKSFPIGTHIALTRDTPGSRWVSSDTLVAWIIDLHGYAADTVMLYGLGTAQVCRTNTAAPALTSCTSYTVTLQ